MHVKCYLIGLVQDCSNSIANALELLQSCTKPSICSMSAIISSLNVLNIKKKISFAHDLALNGARTSAASMLINTKHIQEWHYKS